MAATKKHEIIRVAQENLYMLKRLNEKTSAYNVDKWKKDYEASQYYKRSHCQYPSIDFYKTQKCNSFGNMFTGISKNATKNDFYTKTQYSKYSYSNTNNKGNTNKKRKRFEDFSYRDLQFGKKNNSEMGGDKEDKQFKKISEIENQPEQQPQQEEIHKEEIHKEEINKEEIHKEEMHKEDEDEQKEEKNKEIKNEGENKDKNEKINDEENKEEINREEENKEKINKEEENKEEEKNDKEENKNE